MPLPLSFLRVLLGCQRSCQQLHLIGTWQCS